MGTGITLDEFKRGRIRIKLEEAITRNTLPDEIFLQIRKISADTLTADEVEEIFHGKRSIGTVSEQFRSRNYEGLRIDADGNLYIR